MQGIMATLTTEQQPFVGAIFFRGVSAFGASLTRVMSVYLDGQGTLQASFIGNHAVQLSKTPLGMVPMSATLLFRGVGIPFSVGAFSHIGQVLQTNNRMRMVLNNPFRDDMIGVLLQPSLSSTNCHKSPCRRTSAFVLKTFSQSRIMICFCSDSLSREELVFFLGRGGHSKIPHAYIDANHLSMVLWCGVCRLDFQRNEQVKVFLGLIIPEFSRANLSAMLDQGNVFVIARVGDNHPSLQTQDADVTILLKTLVTLVVVGQGGRNVLGSGVQPLISLLGLTRLAECSILPDFSPERFVGSSYLTWYVTSHLRGELICGSDLIVAIMLQSTLIAHFAMCKRILTDIVQSIAVSQLCLS